jgi:subtilisin family serine protease
VALQAVRAPAAWKHSTGRGITVAVIDSGVEATVVNLRGQVLIGIDMVDPRHRNGWHDPVFAGGHGTGTASIVAGTGRGNRVYGIAPDARILPVRVLNQNGVGPDARVALAIRWATDHGADVINLSLGTAGDEITDLDRRRQHAAVRYAVRHGVVVVAGAGNNGPDNPRPFYPAAFPEVIAVGGTNHEGTRPVRFSDRGDWVDVAAPAVMIRNTNNDGTAGAATGTSFAAPAVAAVVALMLEANPWLSPVRVRRILASTARDLGEQGKDPETGAGIVDAAAAVRASMRAR